MARITNEFATDLASYVASVMTVEQSSSLIGISAAD